MAAHDPSGDLVSLLEVTLTQPAQIGDRARADSTLSTLSYIPGPVIRGAMAAAWIAQHGAPSPGTRRRQEFLDLFEGGVRFGPLFAGEGFTYQSVLSHKYPAGDGCDRVELDEVDTEADDSCPQCHSPWQISKALNDGNVVTHRRASVRIGSAGVAVRGVLFTRDSIDPRRRDGTAAVFTGPCVSDDPALMDTIRSIRNVKIGGRRTTHGQARLRWLDGALPVPRRLDGNRVVLRLRAPAVFVDPLGRPLSAPSGEELLRRFGVPGQVERAWTRWQSVGGWHAASGLAKPSELAVSPGAVYIVRFDQAVPNEALRRVAHSGIGIRNHEGFGHLGPEPSIQPGRLEQHQQELAAQTLANPVGALTLLDKSPSWPLLLQALQAFAHGDEAAGRSLSGLAPKLGDHLATQALLALLAYSPQDIRSVLKHWGQP